MPPQSAIDLSKYTDKASTAPVGIDLGKYADKDTGSGEEDSFDMPTPPPSGTWNAIKQDLSGLFKPSGFSPYPGMDVEAKQAALEQSQQDDKYRQQAGYSPAYRALAPIAQSVGANVTGMEDAAAKGDVGGVLGHAVTPIGTLAVGEAVGHGINKMQETVPSFDRAAGHFNSIETQYGNRPVNTAASSAKVQGLMDRMNLTRRSPVPALFDEFHARTQPGQPPLSFSEARKFYTDMGSLVYDKDFPSQYHGEMKKIVNQFGQEITQSLPTQNARNWFDATRNEWKRAEKMGQGARALGEPIGAGLGAMAGYGAGGGLSGTAGGALVGDVVGRTIGRPVIGSMVDSVLNRPVPPPLSGATIAARTAAIMALAKNGDIAPGEADRRIALLGGKTKVNKLEQPEAPPQ